MNEEFLHFIWKNRLYVSFDLQTVSGESIEVHKPGFHNFDAGPDFIDARIKINDTLWAGNVEIHTKSSDWKVHNHTDDESYNNVILHVVYEHDEEIETNSKRNLPVLILDFDEELFHNYNKLLFGKSVIRCQDKLDLINNIKLKIWIDRVLVKRLERKSVLFLNQLKELKNNWEETFYVQLAKNFGFKTNALPFEMLARSLPLNIIAKHKNSLFQIEALLFGQAGFLNSKEGDDYYKELRKEYSFFRNKFQLQPIDNFLWKFLRLRPANFPTIRIAQFASLLYKSSALFSKVTESEKTSQLLNYFDVRTSEYWENHYKFNEESTHKIKKLGKVSIQNILINTVIPMLFVYGEEKGKDQFKERAFSILESLPAERNHIIQKWRELDIEIKNALDGQALIELYNEFCKPEKCLHCDIGREVILDYE